MCVDCILHLEHHEPREECYKAIWDFLSSVYDPDSKISRLDLYYAEYESLVLNNLAKGSDVCGAGKP